MSQSSRNDLLRTIVDISCSFLDVHKQQISSWKHQWTRVDDILECSRLARMAGQGEACDGSADMVRALPAVISLWGPELFLKLFDDACWRH
jgi:hypothetical protein